jgi:hypothetical protein
MNRTITIQEPTEPVQEMQLIVSRTNALDVTDKELIAFADTLRPIWLSVAPAKQYAATLQISTKAEADAAAAQRAIFLANAAKAKSAIDNFSPRDGMGLKEFLYTAWKCFTGGSARIVDPLEAAAKDVKTKCIAFDKAQEAKAAAEQSRLQAESDARAEAERRRLEKAAEKIKSPELKQERLEAAAAVVPVVVRVAPPAASVKTQKRWVVRSCDLAALGIPANIAGYFKIELHPDGRFRSATLSAENLAGAKSRNTQLEIAGVSFALVSV